MPTAAVDDLAWLSDLRPDERERAAAHFHVIELAPGARRAWKRTDPAHMGVVLSGNGILHRAELAGLPQVHLRLGTGDRWGETFLFASIPSEVDLEAVTPLRVVVLEEPGLRALAREFPVVWMGVATSLSVELKWKNDLLREIQEFDAQRVSARELDYFLESRRRKFARHRAGAARRAGQAFLRVAITDPGREPAFWILTGFVSAIAISRAVVATILHLHLEHELFNLHESGAGNPTHTHHFTYGFVLTIVAGLAAFFPRMRRFLKTLAGIFGFGLGLVFDEFALIWNLNPDYYQRLSYEAQAALLLLLVQVVWFRRFYARLLGRLFAKGAAG